MNTHVLMAVFRRNFVSYFANPTGYLFICLYLWLSLGMKAKIVGISWLSVGLIYGAYRTNFFKKPLQFAKLESTDEPEESK